jgi:CBS domain-containing protein
MTITEFLQDAAERPEGNYVELPIRDFLAKWDAKRRGVWVVKTINKDLQRFGLETEPSFESGWIDGRITVRKIPNPGDTDTASPTPNAGQPPGDNQVNWLRVSSLESANIALTGVTRDDSLVKAQSLMIRNDYSQLPVLSGERNLEGAVSWESISTAMMHSDDIDLRSCIVPAILVDAEDDLLTLIPRVIDAGYVFVVGSQKRISGIVTTADLSKAFQTLAGPFLLVGEAERHLKRIVNQCYTAATIKEVRDPSDNREVSAAEDLSIGEIHRLLENRDRWGELNWKIDRNIFISALQELRDLRNEIMHFSPDPIDEETIGGARRFLKWLELLDQE